jgi:hypothetical protein
VKLFPESVAQEKKFYTALVEELRAGLAFNLDSEACADKDGPEPIFY